MQNRQAWALIGLIGLIGLLVGCGGASQPTTSTPAPPILAVQQLEQAVEAQDVSAMLAALEPSATRDELGAELRLTMRTLQGIEFADTSYELVEQTDDTALVQVRATVVYTMAGAAPEEFLFDSGVDVVAVDGEWYVSGIAPPGAASEGDTDDAE
jgi:hypothetical protein